MRLDSFTYGLAKIFELKMPKFDEKIWNSIWLFIIGYSAVKELSSPSPRVCTTETNGCGICCTRTSFLYHCQRNSFLQR